MSFIENLEYALPMGHTILDAYGAGATSVRFTRKELRKLAQTAHDENEMSAAESSRRLEHTATYDPFSEEKFDAELDLLTSIGHFKKTEAEAEPYYQPTEKFVNEMVRADNEPASVDHNFKLEGTVRLLNDLFPDDTKH